jgi:hypothetical protein
LNATAQRRELFVYLTTLVDAVVVQDDVDRFGLGIGISQPVEQNTVLSR